MVTKGNKKFAGSAGIREGERRRPTARRAFIYEPQRVTEANLEVVRDTGLLLAALISHRKENAAMKEDQRMPH